MLFTLNSMHKKTDVKNHPKFIVIFNDVSLYGDVSLDKMDEHLKNVNKPENYKKYKGRQTQIKRIDHYKNDLKEINKKFYLKKNLSDESKLGL